MCNCFCCCCAASHEANPFMIQSKHCVYVAIVCISVVVVLVVACVCVRVEWKGGDFRSSRDDYVYALYVCTCGCVPVLAVCPQKIGMCARQVCEMCRTCVICIHQFIGRHCAMHAITSQNAGFFFSLVRVYKASF